MKIVATHEDMKTDDRGYQWEDKKTDGVYYSVTKSFKTLREILTKFYQNTTGITLEVEK